MFYQVSYIFKKNNSRFYFVYYPCCFKKQISSRVVEAFQQSNR